MYQVLPLKEMEGNLVIYFVVHYTSKLKLPNTHSVAWGKFSEFF